VLTKGVSCPSQPQTFCRVPPRLSTPIPARPIPQCGIQSPHIINTGAHHRFPLFHRFLICLPSGASELFRTVADNPDFKSLTKTLIELLWESLMLRAPIDEGVRYGRWVIILRQSNGHSNRHWADHIGVNPDFKSLTTKTLVELLWESLMLRAPIDEGVRYGRWVITLRWCNEYTDGAMSILQQERTFSPCGLNSGGAVLILVLTDCASLRVFPLH
jgi:hypothetical protein